MHTSPHLRRWTLLLSAVLPLPAAVAGLVLNPSFEASYNDIWPHYNGNGFNVEVWSGASGINNSTGPFHNTGTAIPDQGFAGFKQGSGSITQAISGLIPEKQYWIQYQYDARAGSLFNLAVKWDGTTLDSVNAVIPGTTQTYRFRNVAFTPIADSGTLEFNTVVTGDSTLLLDAVSIVQRDPGQVVVQNPSFEASGDIPDIGVVSDRIAGWEISGTVGINIAGGPFANNGAIPDQDHALFIQRAGSVTQTLSGLITGKTYTLSLAVNARTGNTPHVLATADGVTVIDKDVTPVGGANAYTTLTGTFVAAAETVSLVIAQTVDASDQTLLVDNVRVAGEALAPLPPLVIGPGSLELAPNSIGNVSITVSKERLARGACVVILQCDNTGVAQFTNPDGDGTVSLSFPANADTTTLTAEIEGFTRGSTPVKIIDTGGHADIQGSVNVEVVNSFVRNPSFDGNAPPASPGYGFITAWTGTEGTGLNVKGDPFAGGSEIPDRAQVGFIQNNGKLSQTVYGLTTGQRYWLQFVYNARDCCDGGLPDLKVTVDNNTVADILDIAPNGGSPYYYHQAEFVAGAETADIAFSSHVTANEDATVVLDGVSIVPRDAGEISVFNPSFEASGVMNIWPGYSSGVAGWTITGGHGINVDERGPFTDNGISGAQDRVLFLQNTASASQVISGLTSGNTYNLRFLLNARNQDAAGGTPYQITVDDNILEEGTQDPVGAGNPYAEKSLSFIAAGDTATIAFKCVPLENADQTLLLDDVHVTAAGVTESVALTITPLAGNSVVLRWPATAPAGLVLKTSTTMATGSWTNVNAQVNVENGQNTVVVPFNGTRRFYQLFQP